MSRRAADPTAGLGECTEQVEAVPEPLGRCGPTAA